MAKGLPRTLANAAKTPAGNLTKLRTFAVSGLPPAAANDRVLVHVSNGAAGSPCLAVSNGTNWLRITLGTAVSAT